MLYETKFDEKELKKLYSDAAKRYSIYNTGTDGNKSEGHVTTNSENHLNISIMQIRLLDAFLQYMKNIDGHQDVSLGDVKVQLLDNIQDQSPSVKKIQESTVDQREHDVDADNDMK
ncbi:unnamed protein product, partial [Rotaria sp. Silwood2]